MKNQIIKKIVTTEIANLALKHNIEKMNGELIETEVGDRFVVNESNKSEALFGAETSGHFYFPEKSNSMDGLVSLIYFLKVVEIFGDEINDELNAISHYKRVQKNIKIKPNSNIDLISLRSKLDSLIDSEKEKLVIRQSIWDPVIRVYYDYNNKNNFSIIEKELNLYI